MRKHRYFLLTSLTAIVVIFITLVVVVINYSKENEKQFLDSMTAQSKLQLESVNNHIIHNIEFVYRQLEQVKAEFAEEGYDYESYSIGEGFNHLGKVKVLPIDELTEEEKQYLEQTSHYYNDEYLLIVISPIIENEITTGAVVSYFDKEAYSEYIVGSMLEFQRKTIHVFAEDGEFLYHPMEEATSIYDVIRKNNIFEGTDLELTYFLSRIEGDLYLVNIGGHESYWYMMKYENVYIINAIEKTDFLVAQTRDQQQTNHFVIQSFFLSVLMLAVIFGILIYRQQYYKKTKLQVETLENSMTGGILLATMDSDLKILYGNSGFYSLVNFSQKEIEEMFQNQLRKLVQAEDLGFLDEVITLQPNAKMERTIRVLTADRGYVWVLLNVSRAKTENKTVTMVMVDVNESKNQGLEIQNLMASIQGGIIKASYPSSRFLYVSKSLCTMMGYTLAEFLDTYEYLTDLIYEKDVKNVITEMGKGQSNLYVEFRVICKDDSLLWLSCNATLGIEEDGSQVYQAVVMDITEKVQTTKSLEQERLRLSTYLELSEEAIIEYIVAEDLLVSSKKSTELFGFPSKIPDFYKRINQMDAIHPDDFTAFLENYSGPHQIQKSYQMDLRLRNRNHVFEWYNIRSTTLYEDGVPFKIITKIVNIDEQRKNIEKLIQASQRDSLTGLYNPKNITRVINEYLAGDGQAGNHILVILDLDDFKMINDRHGHAVGDEIICEFTARINEFFGTESLIGRIGGDEFVVLAKNCNKKMAIQSMQDLVKKMQKAFKPNKKPMLMTASIGISMYPQDGTRYEELFRKADIACYQSKDKGKNVFTFFEKSMLTEHTDVKSLTTRSNVVDVLTTNIVDSLGKNQIAEEGIQSAFDQLSEYFKFTYAYVFEQSQDTYVCTYEYSQNESEKNIMHDVKSPVSAALTSSLRKGSVLYISDINTLKKELPDLVATMNKKKTKSVFVSGVFEEGELKALICFGSDQILTYPSHQELVVLITTSRLIVSHLHLVEERQSLSIGSKMFETILRNQEISAYAIDTKTFELLYVSPRLMKENPEMKLGHPCYEQLHFMKSHCENCPIYYLGDNDRYVTHIYDEQKKRWLGLTITRMEWEQNQNAAMVYTFDITSYIEKVSFKDSLTGLYNLSKFILEGNILIKQKTHPYFIISTNLVDFAYINQTKGIQTGNQLLIEISHELLREIHEGELCCRGTNDKFFLLLQASSKQAIMRRLTLLKKHCDRIFSSMIGFTTSSFITGVYQMEDEETEIEVAMNKAELARKTSEQRNAQMVYYEDSLLEKYSTVRELENRMEYALLNDEFKLYFLPKYNIETREIVGLEALTRWVIDEEAMIYPSVFIPLFESNGFIHAMSYHMIEKVCRFIQKRMSQEETVYPVSINMSYEFLKNEDFISKMQALLEKHQIPPRLIEIEMQEAMFKHDRKIINETVEQARALGFRIAIDDFGAGYSSLISLKDFPVQVIKLDRGFLVNGSIEEKDETILKHIIMMGHELGIEVVSEGVETQEQLEKIQKLGCLFAQGYYLDQPMTPEDLERKLQKHLRKKK